MWAPRIWQQVRDEIKELVDAVNHALGETALESEAAKADIIVITVTGVPSHLSAAFDASTGKIILTLDDHLETYNLEVVRGEVKSRL